MESNSGLTNQTPASRSSDFVNQSYDYRPNWTPLGPISIINCGPLMDELPAVIIRINLYDKLNYILILTGSYS